MIHTENLLQRHLLEEYETYGLDNKKPIGKPLKAFKWSVISHFQYLPLRLCFSM